MNMNGDAMMMNMQEMKRRSQVTEPENRHQVMNNVRWE